MKIAAGAWKVTAEVALFPHDTRSGTNAAINVSWEHVQAYVD